MIRIALRFTPIAVLIAYQVVDAQVCSAPGDLNDDAVVGPGDFAILARCAAGVGAPRPTIECDSADFVKADLDTDGDVDLGDFSLFFLAFGQEYFDYSPYREDNEAERLAIELSGELRAPDEEYNRVHRNLQLIRTAIPQLATVVDHPDYAPRKLLVRLIEGIGTERYATLNRYYVVVNEQRVAPTLPELWLIEFCDDLNMPRIAEEYALLPEVQNAETNWKIHIGGSPDQVRVERVGDAYVYTFIHNYDAFCFQVQIIGVDESGTVVPVFCGDLGQMGCVSCDASMKIP